MWSPMFDRNEIFPPSGQHEKDTESREREAASLTLTNMKDQD